MKCRRNKSQRSQTGSQTRSYLLQKSYLDISLQMIRDVISVQWLLVVTANEVFLENIKLGFHFVKCATNTVKSNNTHFIY